MLENVHENLRPGAVFLLDLMGKEILARLFEPTAARELPDGTLLVERRAVTGDWERVETEWTFIRDAHARSVRFRLWLYSGLELKQALSEAGFSPVELYGNLDGSPYGPRARRLIAVATKVPGRPKKRATRRRRRAR